MGTASAQPVLVHQVPPRPPAFVGASWGAVTCEATLQITAEGLPTEIEVSGCPDAHALAVRGAVAQWRWAPRPLGDRAEATVRVAFPDPGPRPPPYRDFLLAAGFVHASGEGSGVVIAHRAATMRLRMVAAAAETPISPVLGSDVDVRTTRPGAARETLLVGASLGGERVRGAACTGVGLLHRGSLFGNNVLELHVPLEAALQVDAGPVRLNARGRLWWAVVDQATQRAPALVPTTQGMEIAVAATGLIPTGFEPRFGPRIEVSLREEFGHVAASALVGVGL